MLKEMTKCCSFLLTELISVFGLSSDTSEFNQLLEGDDERLRTCWTDSLISLSSNLTSISKALRLDLVVLTAHYEPHFPEEELLRIINSIRF